MVVGQVADTAEACRGLPRAVILGEMHVGARTRWWWRMREPAARRQRQDEAAHEWSTGGGRLRSATKAIRRSRHADVSLVKREP